ncbi:MAG TPA: molybdenum cofactor biosynthesis protein MoaE [Mycobacteriales bacterium]|nr:molybdenum cofactor biosynthesis protein MoaE [Mycobacteriales bacterium]
MIALLDVRDTPLSVDEVLAAVADASAGGVVSFTGLVRATDDGRAVVALEYTAHPSALAVLREVAEGVVAAVPVVRVAALHRVGRLEVGDVAVVVAASAAHRDEAFAAARLLIDDLKARVPIWKDQRFADGTHEWVGLP